MTENRILTGNRFKACLMVIVMGMIMIQSCTLTEEEIAKNDTELDSLNAVITTYFQAPHQYNKEQFVAIRNELDRMRASGQENTTLPSLATSGLLAFMDLRQEEAIDFYLDALNLAEAENQGLYKAILYQEIAKIHFGMRDMSKALDYETKAGQAWLSADMGTRYAHSHNYQGMMRAELGDFESALINFKTSYAYFKSKKDTLGMLPTLDQMANTYFKLDQSGTALQQLEEAQQLSENLAPLWKIKTTHGLARAKKRMGELNESILLFQKAYDLAKDIDIAEAVFLEKEIAALYMELKNYPAAKVHLEHALQTSRASQEEYFLGDLMLKLTELYSVTGDYKLAYEHLRAFVPVNDSINARNNEDTMAKITIEHESAKKDDQLKIQQATIQSQETAQNALFGGVIALLIIILLVVRNLIQKRKTNVQINVQKEEISQSLLEKESLIKEIHHRVKNNLQIIANLLYLQSNKSDDINIKNVLEEGQGRVRSMALIHQKLYENDDLKSIPFGEYILELVNEIKMSFGQQAADVAIKVDAKEAFFDVDSAVPLGLIINELSTNAFKYAFEGRNAGQFNIFLTQESDGAYNLHVSDNGKGIPDEIDIRKTRSLGLRLVRILSEQLEGEYSFESKEGMSFKLKFAA